MEKTASGHVYVHRGARGDVWRAKIRLGDGRQLHRTLGPAWTERGRPPAGHLTRRLAQRWLREALHQADEGLLADRVASGVTVAQLGEQHLARLVRDRAVKATTQRDYRSMLKAHILPEFGELTVEALSAQHVERWQQAIATGPRTRQKVLRLLGGIVDDAVRAGWLAENPVRKVRPPKSRARADIEVLSVEEVWQLVRAASSEQDGAIYLAAALTGLRRGELLALRWGDVDLAASVIRVSRSYAAHEVTTPKSGKGRAVPMAPEVAQALARLAENPDDEDLVFPGIYGTYLDPDALYKRYRRALTKAGLRPLRFHDLRHTFGSRLAAAGVDLHRIQGWMGHADQATTQIYSRWAPAAPDAALIADAFARAPESAAGGLIDAQEAQDAAEHERG